MVFIETFILFIIFCFLVYKWSTRKFHVLTERGVPHEKPKPFIGNVELKILLGKTSSLRDMVDKFLENKHHKVYGSYAFSEPIFVIHDLELIKKIGIKDFDHFVNHKSVSLSEGDKVLGKHLMSLKDLKWKEMRNTLTPSFTGSKLRLMHGLINECSLEDIKYINNEINGSENKEIELEMKDYFTRFANDVIATVAFGIKVNSFKDKDNQFYKTGAKMTEFNGKQLFKAILFTLMPKVFKALGLSFSDQEMMKYFHDLVFDAIKYRQENHITRPDMIQLLLEARRSLEETKTLPGEAHATFDDEDLLAQCLIFFLAGFDTVSQCLCFTLYELVINPEIQQKLCEEIMEADEQLNGNELSYDILTKMDYLNMVISESLRKWPPVGLTDRAVNNDYKLTDEDGNLVVELKKGEQIIIPILGLHRCPEYYPHPDIFDPERFSKDNEQLIKPNSYLPFGIGPRNCIGNRLALMEVKSILYYLIKNFEFGPTDKTPLDMMNAIKGFDRMPKDKFPMKIKRRTSN